MNRLRELREDRDLTLADVGAAIGATATTVARYEAEKRALTAELITQFCEFYGVTADYILGRSPWQSPKVSNLDMAILAAYHNAPEEIRRIVRTALAPYQKEADGVTIAAS